jgi:hypothetical protein
VREWYRGACEAFSDPSVPVCQLSFRWTDEILATQDDELACGMLDGAFVLVCGTLVPIPLPVRTGEPEATDDEVITYGAVRVLQGVWTIEPSLKIVGFIHGFVLVYGVPDPAPWERLIVLP